MKKKQLSEEQQLNEFIGKLASAMFTRKADKIVKSVKEGSNDTLPPNKLLRSDAVILSFCLSLFTLCR